MQNVTNENDTTRAADAASQPGPTPRQRQILAALTAGARMIRGPFRVLLGSSQVYPRTVNRMLGAGWIRYTSDGYDITDAGRSVLTTR